MYEHKKVDLMNPHLCVFVLSQLSMNMREKLWNHGFHTLGKLMEATDEKLLAIPAFGKKGLAAVREMIADEQKQCALLAKYLREGEYDTQRAAQMITVSQMFDCFEMTLAQIGRLIRYQRDVCGRHYDHQELVHTTNDGRVYHCDHCCYRNPDANFCGFCMQKVKDDLEIRRREKKYGI